ncbi:PepSY-like domain-containing protein [Autumnicola edwardsiae]|uniref:PepSY-like domain-containing protein n=1 Tax=Autumnicola edwardsiae TaxID=3075594 RepID=A0ABU3CSL6_9FLAO|nr:PepSY-like domain-containing protein [Zunongwangia sp. F297]MDT0649358.1 PepSY-like domain-containing protein [Zunongwangia sp. F297]
MRRILFTSLLAITISSCNMKDQIAANQVPSVVLNAFQKQYPEAADVEWEKQNSDFEVEFERDNVEYTALINQQGDIFKIKHDASLEEIPETVLEKIKADYADYTIDDVEVLKDGENTYFQLELDKKLADKEIVVSEAGEVLDIDYWD